MERRTAPRIPSNKSISAGRRNGTLFERLVVMKKKRLHSAIRRILDITTQVYNHSIYTTTCSSGLRGLRVFLEASRMRKNKRNVGCEEMVNWGVKGLTPQRGELQRRGEEMSAARGHDGSCPYKEEQKKGKLCHNFTLRGN